MNIITIIAILAITALEVIAITQGLNGTLLAGSIAVIAGLGGYTAGRIGVKHDKDKKPPP